jgi:hypothetical protein
VGLLERAGDGRIGHSEIEGAKGGYPALADDFSKLSDAEAAALLESTTPTATHNLGRELAKRHLTQLGFSTDQIEGLTGKGKLAGREGRLALEKLGDALVQRRVPARELWTLSGALKAATEAVAGDAEAPARLKQLIASTRGGAFDASKLLSQLGLKPVSTATVSLGMRYYEPVNSAKVDAYTDVKPVATLEVYRDPIGSGGAVRVRTHDDGRFFVAKHSGAPRPIVPQSRAADGDWVYLLPDLSKLSALTNGSLVGDDKEVGARVDSLLKALGDESSIALGSHRVPKPGGFFDETAVLVQAHPLVLQWDQAHVDWSADVALDGRGAGLTTDEGTVTRQRELFADGLAAMAACAMR